MTHRVFRRPTFAADNVDFTFDPEQSKLIISDVYDDISIAVRLDAFDLMALGHSLIAVGLKGAENSYEH